MSRLLKLSTEFGIATCVALAFTYLLAVPPAADAVYEQVSSGSTRVILEKPFLRALKSEGVSLSARAPAKLRGATVSFPVIGGKLDPTTNRGVVEHDGALVFRAGRRSIPLKNLQVKTTRARSPLAAKVGGSQLKLATAGSIRVARSGFASRISVGRLSLSAKLAIRLAKKLDRRDLFKPGMPLGRTVTRANPETIAIQRRGRAELILTAAFQAKLDSLFVAVNSIFPAEHPGPFTLPLFAGTISPDAARGTVETQGALEFLQLGGGQVFWRDARIDLSTASFAPESEVLPSPPYAGKGEHVPTASLVPVSSTADPRARTVSTAVILLLSPVTAATFNEVFARPLGRDDVFVAGEPVGSLALTAQGQ